MSKRLFLISVFAVFMALSFGQAYGQAGCSNFNESPELDMWFENLSITYTAVGGGSTTVVLDTFDVDPYVQVVTPGSIFHPPTATPANWSWAYFGYGTPAVLSRDSATVISGASWRTNLPANLNNLDDPFESAGANCGGVRPNNFLCGESVNIYTTGVNVDQVLTNLSQPAIDYSNPVIYSVRVRAAWDASVTPGFTQIRQGLFIFSHDGAKTVNDKIYAPGDNDAPGWFEASISVDGADADNNFLIGIFGAFDYEPAPPCPPYPVPTMNGFGILIFIVIAGLGSIFFLRRKRLKS